MISNFTKYMHGRWLEPLVSEAAALMSKDLNLTVSVCEELATEDISAAPIYRKIINEIGGLVKYNPITRHIPPPPPTPKTPRPLRPKPPTPVVDPAEIEAWRTKYGDLGKKYLAATRDRDAVAKERDAYAKDKQTYGTDPQSLRDMLAHVQKHIELIPNLRTKYTTALQAIIKGLDTVIYKTSATPPDANVPDMHLDDKAARDKDWAITRWLIQNGVKGRPQEIYGMLKIILRRLEKEVQGLNSDGAGGHIANEERRRRALQVKALHHMLDSAFGLSTLGQEVVRGLLKTPALKDIDPKEADTPMEAPDDWGKPAPEDAIDDSDVPGEDLADDGPETSAAPPPVDPEPEVAPKKSDVGRKGRARNSDNRALDSAKETISSTLKEGDVDKIVETLEPFFPGKTDVIVHIVKVMVNYVQSSIEKEDANPSKRKLSALPKKVLGEIAKKLDKEDEAFLMSIIQLVMFSLKVIFPEGKKTVVGAGAEAAAASPPPAPAGAAGKPYTMGKSRKGGAMMMKSENLQEASEYLRMIQVLSGVK